MSQPDDSTAGQHEQVYADPKNLYSVESSGWTGSQGSGLILGGIGCVFFSFFWVIPSSGWRSGG